MTKKKPVLYLSFSACVLVSVVCILISSGVFSNHQATLLDFAPIQHTAPPRPMLQGDINVNTAGMEELMRLPGIGQVSAAAIIKAREKSLFYFPEDLKTVSGIGDKTLEKIRPFICLESR